MYYPNLSIGHNFDTTGRIITKTDVVNFACLSGDFNRLHTDAVFAQNTRFEQRIAHGILALSVISGLTTQATEYRQLEPYIVALISINCRFPKPTFLGDTIFARITVVEKRKM